MAKEYNITKTTGRCVACQRELAAGEEFIATCREGRADGEEALIREDFCHQCWASAESGKSGDPAVFGVWRSRIQAPKDRKKTFVDDELLVSFFERLDGAEEPAKQQFRFVLALILMRKKLLAYDGAGRSPEGQDVWTMHFKGSEQSCKVIDPHLDEEKIAAVSRQLSEVLEADL